MPRRFKAAASSGLSTHLIGGQRRLRHSEKRQRHAIQGFAKRGGFEIIAEFYDAAVSGADPIEFTRGLRGPSGSDRGQRRADRASPNRTYPDRGTGKVEPLKARALSAGTSAKLFR